MAIKLHLIFLIFFILVNLPSGNTLLLLSALNCLLLLFTVHVNIISSLWGPPEPLTLLYYIVRKIILTKQAASDKRVVFTLCVHRSSVHGLTAWINTVRLQLVSLSLISWWSFSSFVPFQLIKLSFFFFQHYLFSSPSHSFSFLG